MRDIAIDFRLRIPASKGFAPGEVCTMRLSQILCLFPESRQIRTVENGWTLEVYEEDWDDVEEAFNWAYPIYSQEVRAQEEINEKFQRP